MTESLFENKAVIPPSRESNALAELFWKQKIWKVGCEQWEKFRDCVAGLVPEPQTFQRNDFRSYQRKKTLSRRGGFLLQKAIAGIHRESKKKMVMLHVANRDNNEKRVSPLVVGNGLKDIRTIIDEKLAIDGEHVLSGVQYYVSPAPGETFYLRYLLEVHLLELGPETQVHARNPEKGVVELATKVDAKQRISAKNKTLRLLVDML